MKKKTIDLFKRIAKQALKPIPKLSVSEWADNYRVISAEGASEPGRWHTSRAPYQREIMDAFTQYGVHKVVVKSCSQIGKALDIDTPIPTPDGWKKIVDLKNGDKVFDDNGNQCNVLWRSDVMENHDCFEVRFSDNTKIVADAEHKWYVEPYRSQPLVLTTRELLKGYKNGKRNLYAIPVAKPLKTETKELLIDPYLLGVWLGDGNSYSAQITMHEKDIEIAGYIKERGDIVKIS